MHSLVSRRSDRPSTEKSLGYQPWQAQRAAPSNAVPSTAPLGQCFAGQQCQILPQFFACFKISIVSHINSLEADLRGLAKRCQLCPIFVVAFLQKPKPLTQHLARILVPT